MTATPGGHGPTPAELLRSQDSLRGDFAELRGEIRTAVANMSDLATGVALVRAELVEKRRQHDSDVRHLSERIDELEDWQQWAFRVVLGAVLLAILAGIAIGTT